MVPSVLVYFNVFQPNVMGTGSIWLMKDANLLYFVIASLVVGAAFSV